MTTSEKISKLLAIPGIVLASALPSPSESSEDQNKSSNRPAPAAANQGAGWTTARTRGVDHASNR